MSSKTRLSLLVAAVFVVTGLITSTWIAVAQFDDPFCYGRVQLWNAVDPGALYFSDAVEFFSSSKVECYHHPGLTLDLIAGSFIRLFAAFHDYHLFVVEHRFFFFGLCSFLSTLGFLACCHPLALLLRRFEIPHLPPVACALFLCSVPVLLFINRFSDEPYYLLFGLWSIELGLRGHERPAPRLWFLAGAAMALSILAKPLMLPALLLVAALSMRRIRSVLSLAAGAIAAGAPLLLKLPVRQWLDILVMEAHNRDHAIGPLQFLASRDQAPLVPHHVALLCAAALGTIVILTKGGPRQRRAAMLCAALAVAQLALIAHRPDWHYYFGWYWCALALAAGGTLLLSRRPVLAFAMLVLALDVWGYPGLLATYKQYHDRWAARLPVVRRDPLSLPAVWEKRVGDTNLSEIFPVKSEKLEETLMTLRRARR